MRPLSKGRHRSANKSRCDTKSSVSDTGVEKGEMFRSHFSNIFPNTEKRVEGPAAIQLRNAGMGILAQDLASTSLDLCILANKSPPPPCISYANGTHFALRAFCGRIVGTCIKKHPEDNRW